ncbi:integrase core domain-containing protein [Kitasatospora mediocidica]|uniref:integrase core domain-containing protein n=1 Tax=Kitasatospora mediocidica TaxID=58352 RepID=UPI000569A6EB|nr:integrase core domain-containing protein [Kitasatospora mediocidica]
MLLRLLYLTLTSVFTLIRLLPMRDRDKDAEILALRHQLAVLQRQTDKPKLSWPDRALFAALLHHLPRARRRRLQLIVSPDTLLHWHRDLLRRRHAKASRPKRPGRPRTVRSVRSVVLRLARNMVMDLQDTGARAKFLIRDRDVRYPAAFDVVLQAEGIEVVQTGVRMPRMNAITERWVRSCRTELLDRTLIWNRAHLLHALREYEQFYNTHRPHRSLASAAPLHPLPEPITEPDRLTHLGVHRRDRLGGILHEYQHAA